MSCAIVAVTKQVPEVLAVNVGVVDEELERVHPVAVPSATEKLRAPEPLVPDVLIERAWEYGNDLLVVPMDDNVID